MKSSEISTKILKSYFIEYAKTMKERFLNKNSLVVEFGSNDGILLKPFNNLGIKAIGVEPAQNIVQLARQKGCEVINDFFDFSLHSFNPFFYL